MAPPLQALGNSFAPRVPKLLNLILIVLIAFTAARILWSLIPAEDIDYAPPPADTAVESRSGDDRGTDFNAIIAAEIFGPQRKDKPVAIDPLVAPDTRLNLKLTGIFAATDPALSRALIKDDSGKQRPYAVGDDIPGNAKLYSIHLDRVLLERKGRYETLRLEQDKLSGVSNQQHSRFSASTSGAPTNITGDALSKLSDVRDQLLQDPTKAGQYIRVQPVYNQGQLQGYRVYPGKNRQLFKDVGLRAGEMVTSINGTQLNDPARALQMVSELSTATQLTVTLERAGQSRTVNINLNQ